MAQIVNTKRKYTDGKKPSNLRRRVRPVRSFKQPPPTLFRRILRLIFNPLTFGIFSLLLLGAFLTATYFWFEFSPRIDLLLSGEVFTQSAGIYSAPKTLKKGEKISKDELVEYLRSANYVKKERKADLSRGRFEILKNSIEIKPGNTSIIDGKRNYRALTVKFNKDGKAVSEIIDQESEKELKQTSLEPELLSSLAAEGDGSRKVVTFNDLPPHLVKAITVTEDRAFFEHYGVNFRGIARALWRRYDGENEGSALEQQGGSSITQQLVKNLLLSPEKSYERKAKEAYMSLILETRLSKQQIFTLYANQIYLGQNQGVSIYGVGEAANIYFGKDVSALTMSESAFIAGIIRSPNRYNPYKRPEKVKQRRNQVLDSMLEAKAINYKQAKKVKESELVLNKVTSKKDLQGMPYFSQYALEQLPKIVNDPEAVQHLRVYTTIDPDLQEIAYKTVNKQITRLEKYFKKDKRGNLNAALVAIKPKTGEIVAMVGGKNYLENQFNRATDAMRQPGSVFKPFVYATAINTAYETNSRIITPATVFKDEKKVFNFNQDTYSPNNYGDYFSNQELTLRDALVKSKNVITVDLAMELNIGKVMNLAHKAGLPKVERAYPSMALGTAEVTPLQMAEAYSTFANLGEKISPIAINLITSGDGTTVVAPTGEKKTVLRPDVAYIMNDMLKDVINRGTAAQAKAWGFKNVEGKLGYAGKTGTSRDGWFVGFTPELITVVYVGFDDGSNLNMKGSDSAMPIWAEFMRAALREHPEWNGDWTMPASIQEAEIDVRNGTVIRELNNADAKSVKNQQEIIKQNEITNPAAEIGEPTQNLRQLYISNIPNEFRRVELFISGTIPNKMLMPVVNEEFQEQDSNPTPTPTPTPFTTWQEAQNDQKEQKGQKESEVEQEEKPLNTADTITIMYCPFSKKRATASCPNMYSKVFKKGTEPKEFCPIHERRSPN
ncbi:MAG: transglycosylase domain-containing protein [Aridibacter sp.]